jgi:hypothetical protein
VIGDFLTHPRSLQVMSDHNLRNIRIKSSIQTMLQLDAIHFQFRNTVKWENTKENLPIENVKAKFTIEKDTKAQMGSRGIALLFL